MGAAWQLPGYDVRELVGFGGSGEVWRGVALDSGEEVALKRLHTTDAVARERIRREAAVLSSVAGEHVVCVRDVVLTDTAAVMVMDYAPGGNLATVLAVRKRLAGPEVVTLVAPLATALADAHERGIVHGDVTPANIVFTADGRPLLGDFGVARAVGAAGGEGGLEGTPPYLAPELLAGNMPTPAADVWALCAIAAEALDRSSAPEALVRAVERGLSDDPDVRVDARTLAQEVLRSCAAAPVGLVRAAVVPPPVMTQPVRPAPRTVAAAPPAPVRHRRRRARRRVPHLPRPVLLAMLSMVALVVAVGGGVAWGHRSQSAATMLVAPPSVAPSPPASTAAIGRPDWRVVLSQLDAQRSRAFTAGAVAALDLVYAPRSRVLALDRTALQSLVSRGLHAVGLTQTTTRVQPVVETPSDATLLVTDEISAYSLVGETGRLVQSGAARPARTFTMELVHVGGGWRIQNITPQ